jgi:hypothetical protein
MQVGNNGQYSQPGQNPRVPEAAPREMDVRVQGFNVRKAPGKVTTPSDFASNLVDGVSAPLDWVKNPLAYSLRATGVLCLVIIGLGVTISASTFAVGKDNVVGNMAKGGMMAIFEAPFQGFRDVVSNNFRDKGKSTTPSAEQSAFNGSATDQ